MNNIEQSVAEKSNKSTEEIANKILHACKSIESMIDKFHAGKKKFSWEIFAIAILSGILSSILVMYILMPKPTLPLTNEQISYLQEGQMLVQMWPKLTKQERERLKTVSFEVMNSKQ